MRNTRLLFCYILLISAGLLTQPATAQIAYNQAAKLIAGVPGASNLFGYAVALSTDGSTIVVGSLYDRIGNNNSQGSAYIYIRSGTTWAQQARLIAGDGGAGDNFGISAAISSDGNTVAIGAVFDTVNGKPRQGSGYIFTRSGSNWAQQAKLTASDGATNDEMGFSSAISADGNTALFGAYTSTVNNNTNQGSAYVFARSGTTWAQQAKLVPSDGAAGDQFGYSAAIAPDGNTAVIGSIFDDVTLDNQGSGYIYIRNGTTWTQQTKIVANNSSANAYMGRSISISGDGNTIVAGASDDQVNGVALQGSAYVFVRSGANWAQQARLLAGDGATFDFFGRSVSISTDGNKVVVGSAEHDVNSNNNQGAAYVFIRSNGNWAQRAQLLASDGAANDLFGFFVSMSGDANTVVVGAIADDGTFSDQGSAYVFNGNNPLPLHLSDFSVARQNGNSLLRWTTTQEQNIATYTIQRSSDGVRFTNVGTLKSFGNTSNGNTYSHTDLQPTKGANYYRLKIMEQDGKWSYSEVRLLNFGNQISIVLFPNPVKDKLTIIGLEAGMSFRIMDAAGKLMQMQTATATMERIVLSGLPKGIYNLQVVDLQGKAIKTEQLVKE